jgi:copper chaperone CopZ
MMAFRVDDMTCGRCAGLIAQAIRDVDAQAQVAVDVPARLVWVDAPDADGETIAEAIRDAGYAPEAA